MTGTDTQADGALHALLADNDAAIRQLRFTRIPHHVGMAAACRALALELPRTLSAQLDVEVKNGALAQRWEAALASAAEAGRAEPDIALSALVLLLREHGRGVMRHLLIREKEWAADAYRLEGHADAIEALLAQLRPMVAAAAARRETPAVDAAPHIVSELDVAPADEPDAVSG